LGAAAEGLGDGTATAQAELMAEALAAYRSLSRRRVALADSGDKAAAHLRPERPDTALVSMTVDERAEAISAATAEADDALESFNAALKKLRAAVGRVEGLDGRVRRRLRSLADTAHKAAAAEAKADKRLLAHTAKGERRLFRSRKDVEGRSGPALAVLDGCVVRDGVLRLPGGTEVPLPDGIDTVDDVLALHRHPEHNLTWSGAVHITDVTDTAGRVTRRTRPEPRKYHVHFLCRAAAPAPEPVTSPEQSLGCDWGVETALVRSDGAAHGRYASEEQRRANRRRHAQAKRLQQSMADKTEGSRRHSKQRRLERVDCTASWTRSATASGYPCQ